jgi:hypothetical protein
MTALMSFLVEEPRAIAATPVAGQLQNWLAQHQPQLRDFHEDADNFGNLVMILTKHGLDVRFVADRGDLLVDVGSNGVWLSDRIVDAFMRSTSVENGRSWPAFDPLANPNGVLRALADPELDAFLTKANVSALEALGFVVAPA